MRKFTLAPNENWSLEQIKTQLSVMKRLPRDEFLAMSPEVRENYISIVEKLAAELSRHVEPKIMNFKNTHLILEAIHESKKMELAKEKEKLSKLRNDLILNQKDKYATSLRRLLFHWKEQHVHVDALISYIPSSYLLKTMNVKNLIRSTVIFNDLVSIGVSKYIIEECILYAELGPKFKEKIEIEDSNAKAKRELYKQHCVEVEQYNRDLSLRWEKLTTFERMKYFCQPQHASELDRIIESGKNLHLSDAKIEEILKTSSLLESYSPDVIPFRKVSSDLVQDISNFSLMIAQEISVPERVIIDQISLQDIQKGKNHVADLLNLSYLFEFEKYWKEISLFDVKSDTRDVSAKL